MVKPKALFEQKVDNAGMKKIQKVQFRQKSIILVLYTCFLHVCLHGLSALHRSWLKVSYTVSNKNTHLADFETCVFRGYLRNHLSYKKVFKIYLHPCLKSKP